MYKLINTFERYEGSIFAAKITINSELPSVAQFILRLKKVLNQ